MICDPFTYSVGQIPATYVCNCCGRRRVKLFRQYMVFADRPHLYCLDCALQQQSMLSKDSKRTIGWLVAAVPTETGTAYWSYSAVPDAGIIWWDNLPYETLRDLGP